MSLAIVSEKANPLIRAHVLRCRDEKPPEFSECWNFPEQAEFSPATTLPRDAYERIGSPAGWHSTRAKRRAELAGAMALLGLICPAPRF